MTPEELECQFMTVKMNVWEEYSSELHKTIKYDWVMTPEKLISHSMRVRIKVWKKYRW